MIYRYDKSEWFLKQETFNSFNATEIMPTQKHPPQNHLHHTPSPNPLQTVPHAAHTMRHSLKMNSVTSIELKCEECFQKQCI